MLPRFYYEECELVDHDNDNVPSEWAFVVFDRLRGSETVIARCDDRADAERIVDALNRPLLVVRSVPPCPVPLPLPCPVPLPK